MVKLRLKSAYISRVFDRRLTKRMQCIVTCGSRRVKAFRQGSDKKKLKVGKSGLFDRGLTKSMLRVGTSRNFGRCLTKSMHCTVHRVGKSRLFDRGLTKSMHCTVQEFSWPRFMLDFSALLVG